MMSERNFQRNTRQRGVILEELGRSRAHPTAVELYEIVRRRLPKVSLGTVYRNLDRLARLGMIHKLEMSGAEARFDADLSPHDHVRCLRCGRVDDVAGPAVDVSAGLRQDFGGYQLLGRRLEFIGVCPRCQSSGSAPPGVFRQDPRKEKRTC